MRKSVLVIAIIALGFTTKANGVLNTDSIYSYYNQLVVPQAEGDMGDWIEIEQGIVFIEDGSTVGYKKTLGYAAMLSKKFGRDFNSPDIDHSVFASYVDNVFDYGSIATSTRVRSTEIKMFWDSEDGKYRVAFIVSDKVCATYILKR